MSRFLEYLCHRCKQTGACPVPYGISMLNAVALLRDAHGKFNPDCHAKYQGRWIEITGVADYNQ